MARRWSPRRWRPTRGRPRKRLRARAQGLPPPLRVRRDPDAAAQPEPRARPRVRVRGAAKPHPHGRRSKSAGTRPRIRSTAASTSTARLAEKAWPRPPLAFGFSFSILFREGVRGGAPGSRSCSARSRPAPGQQTKGGRSPRRARGDRRHGFSRGCSPRSCSTSRRRPRAARGRRRRSSRWWCSRRQFWLISRLEHKRRMEFMRARVAPRSRPAARRVHGARLHRRLPRGLRDGALLPGARRCSLKGSGCGSLLGAATAAIALAAVAYAILVLGKEAARSSRC